MLTYNLHNELDHFFDNFYRPITRKRTEWNFSPKCDIAETKDHFLLSFDLPGVKKEDIKIEWKDRQLTVSGERKQTITEEKEDSFYLAERAHGRFQRSFQLPANVNPDKVEAHYENGVLQIVLPKPETAKPKQIEVKEGSSRFKQLKKESDESAA